jgi:hypothetical protein
MLAGKFSTPVRSLAIMISAGLMLSLSGLAAGANAATNPLPGRDFAHDLQGYGGSNGDGFGPMFGGLGKYITSAAKDKAWSPSDRVAYRADISLMSSSDPIKYKTTFKPAGDPDLAGMRAAGIKLVLTVRNSTKKKDLALPGDGSMDAAFQTALGAMIDQLQPDYLVYGNEVNSLDRYTGTVAQFQHLMTLGHAVAAPRGVKDGGTALMGSVTSQATYEDILATQGQDAATAFKKAADMGSFDQELADEANAYIDACKAAGLDYFVWHSYFSDGSAILDIKSYVEKRFGGASFINELGWRTGKSSTGIDVVDALEGSDITIVLLYGSGEGTNSPDKLWNTDGDATSEGKTISAHMLSL